MGCGASKNAQGDSKDRGKEYRQADSPPPRKAAPTESTGADGGGQSEPPPNTNTAGGGGQSSAAAPAPASAEAESGGADAAAPLPHRGKHMPFPGLREVPVDSSLYYVSCYPHLGDLRGTCFACVQAPPRPDCAVRVCRFTDAELTKLKEDRGIKLAWGSFWKALNVAFGKGEGTVRVTDSGTKLDITLKSSRDPKLTQLIIDLDAEEKGPLTLYNHFIAPGAQAYKLRKERAAMAEEAAGEEEGGKEGKGKAAKEEEHARREAMLNQHEAAARGSESVAGRLGPVVEPLRKEAKDEQLKASEAQKKVDGALRRIKALRGGNSAAHPLDGIYTHGGPRPFQHVSFAKGHEPRESDPDPAFVELVKAVFPRPGGEGNEAFKATMVSPVDDPAVKALVQGLSPERAVRVFQCFKNLDTWEYDCFSLDEASGGDALFSTAYALFYKCDLVKHFSLNIEILTNFWLGAQAGYHPNPYHNSNHAADVLQITHFVLGEGGMAETLKLSKEDHLAALVAAGIHDYDHPGFNNNFHTRTSGYLSTLYNDRSILENHHCSCIFEMMRHPKYDIFANLNDDQRKEVRDTLVEMLLSTDMGNHAKIFSQFRRRLAESPDWHTRKDDIRLALVMAIKMADISNCGRPQHLYQRWAEAIATEFYVQGDAELQMKMQVSPFMDRRKHNTDFPKGQISFINYIVAPLFESMVEFLPKLDFTVRHCQDNKEFWQNKDNEGAWHR
eukprot:TRINITY_DN4956_c2_g1_i1.p1 TRINITY_DN4956_c2_g1~~TRINITY_DN4956_c2_g1_i1.p1  ORF type:complete len:728 (+),score=232.21 TRINITY_DN4956_c2_g1_i1:200-2383(+)